MDDKLSQLITKLLADMADTANAEAQIDGDPGKLGVAVGLGVAVAVLTAVQEGDGNVLAAAEAALIA